MQPVPQGCRPEQVTLALGNAQSGQYGQSQYATGGYGSHAGNATANTRYHTPAKQKRRPKLRGSLGLEVDHSVSGTLFDPSGNLGAGAYNRAAFAEAYTTGSVAAGSTEDVLYTSLPEEVLAPQISFDDVYTAPIRITAGLEYIFSDHVTAFANAGYTRAEGKTGGGATVVDTLTESRTVTNYDPAGAVIGAPITTTLGFPNTPVARFSYDFNELERLDFEVGGRYFFDPMLPGYFDRTITPYIAASGGGAYYSETSVVESQDQRYLERAFLSGLADESYYQVGTGTRTQIYDSQLVPYGSVKAGLEWQMTPKTAMAFEAGVKYEGGREFSNGASGDNNITVPIAIRGSYNF